MQDVLAGRALRTFFKRARWVLALLLLAPLAWFMDPRRLPLALAVSLVGQLVQTWCFAALVKNRELTVRGPYLLVRNPMYLGRYLLILGFVLLVDGAWAVALYTAGYVAYMVSRVRREEQRLERHFGDAYRAYCGAVRRFVPSFRGLADPHVWCFDRAMFLENNAHWNILLTLGAFAAAWGLHVALQARG